MVLHIIVFNLNFLLKIKENIIYSKFDIVDPKITLNNTNQLTCLDELLSKNVKKSTKHYKLNNSKGLELTLSLCNSYDPIFAHCWFNVLLGGGSLQSFHNFQRFNSSY